VLRVRIFHLVQSIQSYCLNSADDQVVAGNRTLGSTTFPLLNGMALYGLTPGADEDRLRGFHHCATRPGDDDRVYRVARSWGRIAAALPQDAVRPVGGFAEQVGDRAGQAAADDHEGLPGHDPGGLVPG
jgi:hypothetical protein